MQRRIDTVAELMTVAQETGNPVLGDPLDELLDPRDDGAASVPVVLAGTRGPGPVRPSIKVLLGPDDEPDPLESVTVLDVLELSVPRSRVPEVVRALSTGRGAYFEPAETRQHSRLLSRILPSGSAGDVVVRTGPEEYRAALPTSAGIMGAGPGGAMSWALALPRLDASDDVRRPPAGR